MTMTMPIYYIALALFALVSLGYLFPTFGIFAGLIILSTLFAIVLINLFEWIFNGKGIGKRPILPVYMDDIESPDRLESPPPLETTPEETFSILQYYTLMQQN